MTLTSIGDLAQGFVLRRQSVELQKQMTRLTLEMASGQRADPSRHLQGRLNPLASVTHELRLAESHRSAAREVQVDSAAMQNALDRVQTISGTLGPTALNVGITFGQMPVGIVTAQARGGLADSIAALNATVADRALFAGADIRTAPLASADTLLSTLREALRDAGTVAEVQARADLFFDDPAGAFATLIYQGSGQPKSPVRLGAGETVALDLRADDPGLRRVLRGMALTALANDPALALDGAGRRLLLRQSGEALMSAQQDLAEMRGSLGVTEARIDQSVSRIGGEIASLSIARSDLLSTDPFDTAIELEQVQFRLETLYTVTARNARLSLVNFL